MRGARVKDVVHELNGERVDIIRWNEDPVVFITNALSPARPREIRILEDGRAEIIVDDDQFALAVGKKGQGIRLVSKLTGWKVDIKKASDLAREDQESQVPVRELDGLAAKVVAALEENGYATLGPLRKADAKTLMTIPGIGEKTAQKISHAAAGFRLPGPEPVADETIEPAVGNTGDAVPESGGEGAEPAEAASDAGDAPAESGEPAAIEPDDGTGSAAEGGDSGGEKSDGPADGAGA
jgi:N utilization substance protein A